MRRQDELSTTGVEAEKVSELMHDINGALWVAISSLDLTLADAGVGGCNPKSVQEALDYCLEIAAKIGQLQYCLPRVTRTLSTTQGCD